MTLAPDETLSLDEIRKLARLSRLALDETEIAALRESVGRVIAYVSELESVDVEGVEPMVHAIPTAMTLRKDVARPVVGRAALAGAAGYRDGRVRVPKIVE